LVECLSFLSFLSFRKSLWKVRRRRARAEDFTADFGPPHEEFEFEEFYVVLFLIDQNDLKTTMSKGMAAENYHFLRKKFNYCDEKFD
jgi:hypothetical protein